MTRITTILATVLALAFTPLAAQDYQKGLAAYQAGDFATALQEWTPLAVAGDASAQFNLGYMYDNGDGVLQDNVTAHMWYNIGAANGSELGRINRDIIAEGMSQQAIEQAQAMARDCMSSGYQNCGLDLRGSVQLLAEVKVEQVYEARMHSLWPEVRDTLAAQRDVVGFIRRESSVAGELRVRISQPDGMNHALELVSGLARITGVGQIDIAVRAVTDTDIIITLTDPEKLAIEDQTMRQTLEVVRRRIDEMGVRGLSIQRRGATSVLIQLPSISSAQEVKYIIGTTAQLGFHPVVGRTSDPDARAGAGNIVIPSIYEPKTNYVLERRPVVSGEDVLDAQPALDKNDRPALNFRFNMTGSRKFSEYTADNIGSPFAIVLDNEVVSAPVIQSHIAGGSGIITGRFSVKDVTNLAILLRAGSLPAELEFLN